MTQEQPSPGALRAAEAINEKLCSLPNFSEDFGHTMIEPIATIIDRETNAVELLRRHQRLLSSLREAAKLKSYVEKIERTLCNTAKTGEFPTAIAAMLPQMYRKCEIAESGIAEYWAAITKATGESL